MDFVLQHKGQLAVVTALVVYSAAKNKLTPGGIAAAIVTAGIHMVHPWGVFFNLLVGFFVTGTVGTKVRSLTSLLLPRTWDDILFNTSQTRG
jgi:uncharacterized membrane protein